jgi:hypothetical protein
MASGWVPSTTLFVQVTVTAPSKLVELAGVALATSTPVGALGESIAKTGVMPPIVRARTATKYLIFLRISLIR